MRLSICIATFNRAGFIGETLDAILPQLTRNVELVVVDGASVDCTAEVMADYVRRFPAIVYRRETENCGVDRDFDKAVQYANGDYCWLMSDDDILVADAIATVLGRLADEPELVVVNAEVWSKDLSVTLKPRQLAVSADCDFGPQDHERLFAASASYLSFIGAVVIRRATWMGRERTRYFGSLFIHVGVIFQPPQIGYAKIIARPLIRIRYGNAMWTARGFEIWIDKWPNLIWSFAQFTAETRSGITARHPANSLKVLLHYRAIGAFGRAEYRSMLADRRRPHHSLARAVAALPARVVNAALALYCLGRRHADARMMLHDLVRASCASSLAQWVARRFRFPEMEK